MTTDRGETTAEAGRTPAASGTIKWQQTAHGKGRVRPRKAPLPEAVANVLRLTAVAYTDAEHGEREGDPRPRFPEAAARGWVEYVELDSAQRVYRAINQMRAHQPVLLRGTPLVAGLVGRWSFRHLASSIGADRQLRVLCSDAKRRRFIECDDAKNVYGGMYHVREPETQRLDMAFPDFVQCAAQWRARRVHVRETVMEFAEEQRTAPGTGGQPPSSGGGAAQRTRPRVCPHSACGRGLRHDLEGGVDWGWLGGLLRTQGHGPVAAVDLEAGTADGLLPARYELRDRLVAQVAGRRRVLLLSPEQAFAGLYPYPLHHPYDRHSMVDLEAPDPALWPKAGDLRGLTAVLGPGDVLYVPAFWFLHSQDLESECLALTLHLSQGARPPSPEGTPLRLSRALEARVAQVEGAGEVRHWLQLIGHGEEHEWIDLGTVRGYRRIVFCQGVRDDVEAALGPAAWAHWLPRMCEGRLVPTPWLNKDFREPLYLLERPVVLQDGRTEEERKYPELFRTKLTREGWHVPAPVSTVPIPGVNMPKDADYRTWGMASA